MEYMNVHRVIDRQTATNVAKKACGVTASVHSLVVYSVQIRTNRKITKNHRLHNSFIPKPFSF